MRCCTSPIATPARRRSRVEGWTNGAHVLKPAAGGALDYWSFSGASYVDRRDWVQQLYDGFDQRNFMGMNAPDYGGGTPVVDVWRRDCGLAVGHVETVPKLVALPLTVTTAGARVAVECNHAGDACAGRRALRRCETFVAVHRGDFFATLDTYRQVLAERGMPQAKIPPPAYEPVWCGWGYERDFTVDQMLGTLPKARELGLGWAVLDDGWQTALGDWYLDPKKFPRGDADMIAFVKTIKDRGHEAEALGRAARGGARHRPAARPSRPAAAGQGRRAAGRDRLGQPYVCALPIRRRSNGPGRSSARSCGDWGFEGLKIDGQHLNGVAPCYNPAHKHARPEELVEKLQDFWKAVYEEATAINPNAVIEICPCGTSYAVHNMPYMNQAVGSDPLSSEQVRLQGQDHQGADGTVGRLCGRPCGAERQWRMISPRRSVLAAVVSTKFTWPRDPKPGGESAADAAKRSRMAPVDCALQRRSGFPKGAISAISTTSASTSPKPTSSRRTTGSTTPSTPIAGTARSSCAGLAAAAMR